MFDLPRLYRNRGCRPEAEWMKFTPIDYPKDKLWTAKDAGRYLRPLLVLSGYKDTIGFDRR